MPPVSDLRREFETPPYSRQVSLGSQVEMRCHPPKGKPAPMVTWLKNGSPVREGGNGNGNLLVTGAGHLIVVKTRWADAANYSCVAENVAARRVSQAAQLTVYGKTSALYKLYISNVHIILHSIIVLFPHWFGTMRIMLRVGGKGGILKPKKFRSH